MPEQTKPVRVRLFARARDIAGCDIITVDLPGGATVGELRGQLASAYPALRGLLERSALAVNEEFATDSEVIPVNAEVALLPPVSGGGEGGGDVDSANHGSD